MTEDQTELQELEALRDSMRAIRKDAYSLYNKSKPESRKYSIRVYTAARKAVDVVEESILELKERGA